MILPQAYPYHKSFFRLLKVPPNFRELLLLWLAGFLIHNGSMSAAAASQSIRSCSRHRGNTLRFLHRLPESVAHDWLEAVGGNLLADEPPKGLWLFLIDQTYCGHQGVHTENTFSTGHHGRRQKHARKHERKKKMQAQRSCHGFIMGLLLTPTGWRIPCFRSYYTQAYCQRYGLSYRKQTDYAADLIDTLRVPAGVRLLVVGDTAFDAASIQAACRRRHFSWVVAMNGERVLPGPSRPRAKVSSLAAAWPAESFVPIRLTPGQGIGVAQRRISRCRLGPKAKTRTFYVHQERCTVVSVGEVQVLFSTKEPPIEGQTIAVQKILMTNDLTLRAAEIIEVYDLRWQIELFFKELKSTLGLAQYRFREFAKVRRWVLLCLLSFVYLEWYRREKLRKAESPPETNRWLSQRSHGLCAEVRQEAEQEDVKAMERAIRTRGGVKRLRRLLRHPPIGPNVAPKLQKLKQK